MNEQETRLVLACVVEPGDEKVGALIAEYGVEETYERARVGEAGGALAQRLSDTNAAQLVNQVQKATRECGSRFITPINDEWVRGLDDLEFGQPIGLWVTGDRKLDEVAENSVAVVGARASTSYGERVASDLGSQLGTAGISSVSGAAYGIDAAVHRGSLAAGGTTIAVLACGVDVAYPAAHRGLLDRIKECGLVVSEAPPGTKPHKHRFLIRNRLIAALAQSTVVVEAALRSGSLSTSMWAHTIGRQVWGIPGPITSATSAGVHAAIRDGVMDLAADLKCLVPRQPAHDGFTVPGLEQHALAIQNLLKAKPHTTDELVGALPQFVAHEILSSLTLLELRGLVHKPADSWALAI